jgi:hypothetical protein
MIEWLTWSLKDRPGEEVKNTLEQDDDRLELMGASD